MTTDRATPETDEVVSAWLNRGDPFGPSSTARNPVVVLCESFELEIAALRAQATEWTHIDKGLPPCDGDTVYVGINSMGHCGCFNNYYFSTTNEGVVCIYGTKKYGTKIMTCLKYWKQLDMPKEQP